MWTFLIIVGIWLLINVLFVVVMMPPRKPRKSDTPRPSLGLAPATVERNAYPFDEDEKVSLRHTIIAIAMGALFSLTPPLLEAADDIKRLVRRYCRSRRPSSAADGRERSLETIQEEPRASEERRTAEGSPPDRHGEPQR